MSLYDKYHSNHNKTYMYNLISNLIKDEYKINVNDNKPYNDYFEINFKECFLSTDTEDIKDLNKNLLDNQLTYFTNTLVPSGIVKKEEDNQSESECIISSSNRDLYLNSTRFNYKFTLPTDEIKYKFESMIIPIEDSPIFSTPLLHLKINKILIQLQLRGTIQFNHREYGIYTPFSDKELILQDTIKITIKNQFPYKYTNHSDIYKIDSLTIDNYKYTLHFQDDISNEFMIHDYIKVSNYDKIETSCKKYQQNQYKIIDISDKSISIHTKDKLCQGFYVQNITLQNTLCLSYA